MNILDSRFKYTPSHATDIRKTFERIRLEQAAEVGRLLDAMPYPAPQQPAIKKLWRLK